MCWTTAKIMWYFCCLLTLGSSLTFWHDRLIYKFTFTKLHKTSVMSRSIDITASHVDPCCTKLSTKCQSNVALSVDLNGKITMWQGMRERQFDIGIKAGPSLNCAYFTSKQIWKWNSRTETILLKIFGLEMISYGKLGGKLTKNTFNVRT